MFTILPEEIHKTVPWTLKAMQKSSFYFPLIHNYASEAVALKKQNNYIKLIGTTVSLSCRIWRVMVWKVNKSPFS